MGRRKGATGSAEFTGYGDSRHGELLTLLHNASVITYAAGLATNESGYIGWRLPTAPEVDRGGVWVRVCTRGNFPGDFRVVNGTMSIDDDQARLHVTDYTPEPDPLTDPFATDVIEVVRGTLDAHALQLMARAIIAQTGDAKAGLEALSVASGNGHQLVWQ